jgi:hypothetical protein
MVVLKKTPKVTFQPEIDCSKCLDNDILLHDLGAVQIRPRTSPFPNWQKRIRLYAKIHQTSSWGGLSYPGGLVETAGSDETVGATAPLGSSYIHIHTYTYIYIYI